MDRELLLEIGCEELPASWLPDLTRQLGDVIVAELRALRLGPATPAETYSTPRRLTVRVQRLPDHQKDLEELVTGPPVSAAFTADGTPTPAAVGFAARQGTDPSNLERVETPKGTYVGYRKRQRGRAAIDVLPEVLASTLRGLRFPKLMHWDAVLEDGRGELLFGRPIRWLLFLYGGRVVPFTIGRAAAAQGHRVQEIRAGAATYGHRFLATSGRAGRAIKVRSFDEYRARLLENFVMLERSGRHDKIARELDARAQRLQGRVGRTGHGESSLLEEVPDLVEYPAVIAGTFGPEFLLLPPEVLRTTLIHHQHYFPVEAEDGHLKPAFLAVTNTEPEDERLIARNAERVVTARLRDARFFWEADRRTPLASRIDRLGTLLFHRKLGTYRDKSDRVAALAARIAETAFGAPAMAELARTAGALAKADLTTDMVREFTELQGTMGGIYAREEGQPEEVWKAIYFHYLPIGVEPDAPPSAAALGKAGPVWAAVSLADKLDTIVGLFGAGEKPTGSRDPYGLRRAGQGVVKVLADLPPLGIDAAPTLSWLVEQASAIAARPADARDVQALRIEFWLDRLEHLLRQRGISEGAVRAVLHRRTEAVSPLDVVRRAEAIDALRGQPAFIELARLFKRINNIVHDQVGADGAEALRGLNRDLLREPAEVGLRQRMDDTCPRIGQLAASGHYLDALKAASELGPLVDRFFTDVLVMSDDAGLRQARLALLGELRDAIWDIADIPAVVQDQAATP